MLNRVEIRRLTFEAIAEYSIFLTLKTPGLVLLCFGSSSILL